MLRDRPLVPTDWVLVSERDVVPLVGIVVVGGGPTDVVVIPTGVVIIGLIGMGAVNIVVVGKSVVGIVVVGAGVATVLLGSYWLNID